MEFWKVVAALLMRKSVAIPVIGLAVAVGALAFVVTPPRYVSSTTMVLTTPTSGATLSQDPNRPNGLTNPLLNFDTGLKTTSTILIQAMNTPEVGSRLGATGGSTKMTIDDGSSNPALLDNNGPFVYIQVESATPEDAQSVVLEAQQLIRQELVDRQVALNAPPETYIAMTDVVSPTAPEITRAMQMRMTGVGFVGTFLLGMALAYYLYRRKGKQFATDRQNLDPAAPVAYPAQSTTPPPVRRLNGGAKQIAIVANGDGRVGGAMDGGQRQLGQWPRSLGMRRPETRIVDAVDHREDDRSAGGEPEKSA